MKKAIITGGSKGLGHSLIKIFLSKGTDVVNISRNNCDLNVINIPTDLSDHKQVDKCIEEIKKNHSSFDVLVLNAGIMNLGEVGKINFDTNKMFDVNIISTIKLINGLINIIKKNKGDIVIVGSTSSFRAPVENSVYSATKHGLIGFIKSLQCELKNENVRVIGFHPGGFNSNLRGKDFFNEKFMDPEDLAKLLIYSLELPRSVQVSEIIIDKKPNGG